MYQILLNSFASRSESYKVICIKSIEVYLWNITHVLLICKTKVRIHSSQMVMTSNKQEEVDRNNIIHLLSVYGTLSTTSRDNIIMNILDEKIKLIYAQKSQ